MRIQIYVGSKTQEDRLLREALQGHSNQGYKDLLLLGWRTRQEAAGNSTTNFDTQEPALVSSEDTQDVVMDVDADHPPQEEVCTSNLGEEIDREDFSTTNSSDAPENSPTKPDAHEETRLSEEVDTSPVSSEEADASWRQFVESGGTPLASTFPEVDPPDLAKLRAITDAGQQEREEVRRMLGEQLQNQGTDPLEETKKNIEKAKGFWSKKKNDDTATT